MPSALAEGLSAGSRYADRATAREGNKIGGATGAGASGRSERSQPAESHDLGMENSLQPQSRHTTISGAGDMGGWLSVRGPFR
jgi:hypothetical protein